jgi:hypothetical protein
MDSRFRYVWQHFKSLYQVPDDLQVAYGVPGTGLVTIACCSGDFFEGKDPWPDAIAWQDWQGRDLPFLFSPAPATSILTTENDRSTIHHDIIGAAFYFLSGWQEYHCSERDRYGRFPYHSSLQYKLGIITLPVVNYYFDILKTAIEKAAGITLPARFNEEATFTACLTHDIDNTESGWKAEGRAALGGNKWMDFLKGAFARLRGRDAWFNWQEVARQVRLAGGISTFFFLCQDKPYRGTANADYAIKKEKYQAALRILKAGGAEIAVHGSLEAAVNGQQFLKELDRLPAPVQGTRFHYLSFDPRLTPALLDAAGLAYDSTLGFAEHYGFRHSYCFPFRLFNFLENKPYDFLEIPLILMDATLDHPKYLQLNADEVLPAIRPVLSEIAKFRGCFTLLWHNENFSAYKKNNGPAVFHQILAELNRRQAAFKTGTAIQEQFAPLLRDT